MQEQQQTQEQQLQSELVLLKAKAYDDMTAASQQINQLQGTLVELCKLAEVETVQELADRLKPVESTSEE